MPMYDIDNKVVNNPTFSIEEVWMIVSIILAVIGGIYLFTNFFNKEKSSKYTGFKKKIFDFIDFKITIIEPILKVLYLITALSITLSSFSYLSNNFFKFILILVFGNIIVRLTFEIILLTLKMFKDVKDINKKLSKTKKTD